MKLTFPPSHLQLGTTSSVKGDWVTNMFSSFLCVLLACSCNMLLLLAQSSPRSQDRPQSLVWRNTPGKKHKQTNSSGTRICLLCWLAYGQQGQPGSTPNGTININTISVASSNVAFPFFPKPGTQFSGTRKAESAWGKLKT